jgi:cytidyltransferase-like protein
MRKILVMGLPGAGKTTLAAALAPRLNAVRFNADEVRANVNKDLGFSPEDRIEHARRMGWLCDQVTKTGSRAVADFICPTAEARTAFGDDAFVIWVDRIKEGRFEDTNRLFQPPARFDVRVTADGTPESWAERIAGMLQPHFDPTAPTALFVGRYQPFHDGHKALIEEGLARTGQVCIAVRDTHGTDAKNPFSFEDVKQRIEVAMRAHAGRFVVVPLPNITEIFYGRDVGYRITEIVLAPELQQISATEVRRRLGEAEPGDA